MVLKIVKHIDVIFRAVISAAISIKNVSRLKTIFFLLFSVLNTQDGKD